MTLEEVMNNITILNDMTTINLAVVGIGIGLILTILSVIRTIKEQIYPRGFWIATAVCFGIITAKVTVKLAQNGRTHHTERPNMRLDG